MRLLDYAVLIDETALFRRMISPLSYAAPPATNLRSTPSDCPAATRQSAKTVRIYPFSNGKTYTNKLSGQSTLPEACPVCAHAPLDATLCKPNKALRTTLKAFLRTEEKKREKAQATTPTVQSTPTIEPTPSENPTDQTPANEEPTPAAEPAPKVETAPETAPQPDSAEPAVTADADAQEATVEPQAAPEQTTGEAQPEQEVGLFSPGGAFTQLTKQKNESQQPENPENAPEQAPPADGTDPSAMQNGFPSQNFPMQTPFANGMGFGMNGPGFPMGWNQMDFNPMMPMMNNGMGMMPFQNPMGEYLPPCVC